MGCNPTALVKAGATMLTRKRPSVAPRHDTSILRSMQKG